MFHSVNHLFRWFKEHFRDPLPQKTPMRTPAPSAVPGSETPLNSASQFDQNIQRVAAMMPPQIFNTLSQVSGSTPYASTPNNQRSGFMPPPSGTPGYGSQRTPSYTTPSQNSYRSGMRTFFLFPFSSFLFFPFLSLDHQSDLLASIQLHHPIVDHRDDRSPGVELEVIGVTLPEVGTKEEDDVHRLVELLVLPTTQHREHRLRCPSVQPRHRVVDFMLEEIRRPLKMNGPKNSGLIQLRMIRWQYRTCSIKFIFLSHKK